MYSDYHQKIQVYFFFLLLAVIFVISLFIFKPFLYSLTFAMVFAIIFKPIYQKMLKYIPAQKGLVTLLALIIIVVFIITPLLFLTVQIFQEAIQLYSSVIENGGKNIILNIVKNISNDLQKFLPESVKFSVDFNQYLKEGLSWLVQNIGLLFSSFAKIMINFFVFLVALYYLLKDGQKLKNKIINLSPLSDIDDKVILDKLELAVNSVMKGSLFIAITQGILAAIGFVVFGIPNATLWGSVTVVTALIPGIGTALVLIPAVGFLFLKSNISYAIGLFIWGIIIGTVDNFLRPKLIERGIKLHPLLVLLAVLGGISLFGPIGFLFGPLVLSLLFALLDIYSRLFIKRARKD